MRKVKSQEFVRYFKIIVRKKTTNIAYILLKNNVIDFSLFKEKFGARHVTYIDSYDFVINEPVYKMFIVVNDMRWRLLNILK